jgi:FAD/FMN-containing dehydrogenase
MKIVILGAGQVGGSVAESLVSEQNDITVIDLDPDRLRALQDRFDLRTVMGSGGHPSVLREAGIEDADLLIAVTQSDSDRGDAGVDPRCLEYLDAKAFAIARDFVGGSWAGEASAYAYVEEEAFRDREVDLDAWLALAESHGALADDIQVFEGEQNLRDARRMRHAVPATLNERAAAYRAAGGRKVSTDWAVPYARLHEALVASDRIAAAHGVETAATFGHAGNGHPHQHYHARDAAELERMEAAVEETLRHVVSMGGTVSAEHGIGKVKRQWLAMQLGPAQLGVMRAVKRELDPLGILSPGNVFQP